VLPNYPGGVFAVSRKWADENRQLLVKFLGAWSNALCWCHGDGNRSDALKVIAAEEKQDERGAARKLAQLPPSGKLNLAGLQSVLDLRVQFHLTPPMGKDLARYYEESFYREASNS
jgi:ABC-type nitrate/sulfonate/bicarbonate transport system substrate-binding protein